MNDILQQHPEWHRFLAILREGPESLRRGFSDPDDEQLRLESYKGGFNRPEPSMSRRGNCWDNAVADSFFSGLKKERVKKRIYKNRTVATEDISDYIETFYNQIRRHSHLSGMSSVQYETAAKLD